MRITGCKCRGCTSTVRGLLLGYYGNARARFFAYLNTVANETHRLSPKILRIAQYPSRASLDAASTRSRDAECLAAAA